MSQKLDAIDSGSNYNFGEKLQVTRPSSSVFSLSHNNTITFPPKSNGMLIPILTIPTVPTDTFQISCDTLLRVLPQVVPLYSRQRIYIHAFYCRNQDLWRNWNVFASKGYSGNRNLTVPTINSDNIPTDASFDGEITDDCLLHYLYGLPIGTHVSDYYGKVTALPLMMYHKIWRDYFMNKDFYIDNRAWLPDDDADFRLGDDGLVISFANEIGEGSEVFDFWNFRYRDFADDRFTSAKPSPQRGIEQKLHFDIQGGFSPLVSEDGSLTSVRYTSRLLNDSQFFTFSNSDSKLNQLGWRNSTDDRVSTLGINDTVNSFLGVNLSSGFDLGITLNDLRTLTINQTELEKMAHTDGSYREFGLSFFGMASKTAVDYRPVYFGSTYQPIVFSEVIQTVPYETDGALQPLGTYGGHGISSNNGQIGSITCDDYGYIMLIASVMPDTYYSQGLDKQWTQLTQADLFLPERAKLGMQPITNGEIFFTGNAVQDNELFAYQDIFDEMRYMPNVVHGQIANPDKLSFYPYTQSRRFTSLPTFSQSFATTKDNVRMDFLAGNTVESPYTAQFGFNIRAVRPLPYRAIPASLI